MQFKVNICLRILAFGALLTFSSKEETISLYVDRRDDLGVSLILLKLDIRAK